MFNHPIPHGNQYFIDWRNTEAAAYFVSSITNATTQPGVDVTFTDDREGVPCGVHLSPQLILWFAPGVSDEGRSSPLLVPLPPFLDPGFRIGARWNRLGEAVKTRKKREKTEQKWARYGLRSVNKERMGRSATLGAGKRR